MSATGAPTLRPVTLADEPFLLQVFASTREAELAALPPAVAEPFLHSQFELQRRAFASAHPDREDSVVLDAAGTPVGRIVVSEGPAALHLVEIALLTSARGSGIGTALITALQQRATDLGVPLLLHAEAGGNAQRLYERLGFTVITAAATGGSRVPMRWEPPGLTTD